MKIGIITFHDANNYGAVLQAYALKNKISEYCNSDIINYYNSHFHKNMNLKNKLKQLLYIKDIKKKNISFSNFRKENLKIESKFLQKKDLYNLNDYYDYFITGSDQVWNLNCSGNDDSYFLDFVSDNCKKISYSASFGTSNPDLDSKHINYIKNLKMISVRENTGKEYLKKLNINSVKTCDPVFLLKKEQWEKLTKQSNEKYILVYEVVNGVNMIEFSKKLSSKFGIKVKVITSSNKPILGVETIRNAGPIEWLTLIKNAQLVVTNSFHGLAFSLIFNKQFYIELLAKSDSNTRMLELLKEVKLQSRVITQNTIEKLEEISFEKVNSIIEKKRNFSIKYIEKIIGGTNEK